MKQENNTAPEWDGLVRSDLNLEKWPLFGTKMKKGYREITRDVVLPDGTPQRQTVKIGLKGATETLTSEEALIFYAILDIWQIQGRPADGVIKTTVNYLLNRLIQKEGGEVRRGNWSREWLKQKLSLMMRIPIQFGFFDRKDGKRETNISLTLLAESHIWERETAEKKERSGLSYIRIHSDIVKNLLERHVKPIRFDVIVKLKETARILYRYLDLMMFDKLEFKRDVTKLAEELGIGASRSDHLLTQFRSACEDLEGKNMSAGRIEYCRIERRVNEGWNMVIRKGQMLTVEKPESTVTVAPLASVEQETIERELEREKRLKALYESLSEEEKKNVETRRFEIQKTVYGGRIITEMTTNLARLDALEELYPGLN